MTYEPNPGTTLAAAEAISSGQQSFTRDQVAYLIHIAFLSGIEHARAFGTAVLIAGWEIHQQPHRTRDMLIAERLAEYEHHAGPVTYHGGPVDWGTGKPTRNHLKAAA